MLLGRDDVNPDKPDEAGRTPLWWASHNGCEGVVKLLLGRDDINPDKPDERGQTPLWWAAYWGYEGIVETLLGREGANPDMIIYDDFLPLRLLCWPHRSGSSTTTSNISHPQPDLSR